MADPMSAIVSTALSVGGTLYNTMNQQKVGREQAAFDAQKQQVEAAWAERRAKDAEAAGQIAAGDERRKADLLQGTLINRSGAAAGDPSVERLAAGIEAEGSVNASRARAAGEQKGDDIRYQSRVDAWTADNKARVDRLARRGQLVGGLMQAGAQAGQGYTRMSQRYRNLDAGTGRGTGYG